MKERFEMFTVLISTINRSIHRIKTEKMAEFDLKSSHVSCLYYLFKEKELTAKELCDICEEDKANISRSVKYLETNGYLECRSKTQKRYLSPLVLTEKGIEVAGRIVEKIDSVLSVAGEGISEENRKIMYESLAQISANLQKACGNYEN